MPQPFRCHNAVVFFSTALAVRGSGYWRHYGCALLTAVERAAFLHPLQFLHWTVWITWRTVLTVLRTALWFFWTHR